MKVLIIGSRNISDFDLTAYVPKEADMIISGGADGIDSIAERYADKSKISKLILRPDYKKYGKAAPLKRNEVMIDYSDIVIAVWDGKSKGTKYSIDYAKKKNKEIVVITKNGVT